MNATPANANPVVHLTVRDVASRYRKSVRWVREMVRFQKIPHMRIGGSVLFSASQLKDWEDRKTC